MKAKLQAIKDGDSNVYSHLVNVLKTMLLNNDKDSYQLFQYYSQQAKKSHGQAKHEYRTMQFNQFQDYLSKATALLNKPNVGTAEEPAEPGPCGFVANLMEESKWFEKAGVGFGEQCTYLIFKAMERFSIIKSIKQLKFWGKIIGTVRDYYIVEGTSEGGQEGQLAADIEPKGTGINKMTYWVTTDLLSNEWKELPLISPDHLRTSRRIKYLFTGDLERVVCTNPFFNGKEAHLLKAQIVRISYGCQLVPRTMFTVNAEDKKEIEPAPEEWKLPDFEFLSQLDNWVHHPQNILLNGRLTLLKPIIPEGVEVDQQKLMKELQAKDPMQERLKPVSKDVFQHNKAAWAVKVAGDCNEYRAASKNKQYVNYGYICLKSLVWKGWTLVYHNKQWATLYVGLGKKVSTNWYYPKEPEMLLSQRQDRKEQPEPNFPPQEKKPEMAEVEEPKPEE